MDRRDSGWNAVPISERIRWAGRFRRIVAARADELSDLIEFETGKPRYQALLADVAVLLSHCRWVERHAARLLRPRRLGFGSWLQLGHALTETRIPLGRVGIIATWNYPVQLLGIQLVHALVAGNEVIVKPSEHTPRTQVRLLELAVEAGLPSGVVRWTEATRNAGQRILDDNDLDHVVFTGSTSVGRTIAAALGTRLVSSCLELSGRDSALVLSDADAEHAARTLWRSVRKNAGQTCMAPRRALVEPGAYAAFVAAIERCAADNPPVRLIAEAPADAVRDQVRDAVRAGGRAIPPAFDGPDPRSMPAVFVADCPEDAALVEGDHFGPALAIVPVRDLTHALAIHHRIGQHLATSIFTRDPRRAAALAPRLNSSHVTINESVMPTAHPAACLGGHGASGWGVTRGRDGLLAMTRPVTISRPAGPVRLPSDPPDEKTLDGLRRFIGLRYAGPGWRRLAAASESPRPTNPTPHGESGPETTPPVPVHAGSMH